MLRRVMTTVFMAALAGPALAQSGAGELSAAFKGTIISTYPDGRTAKLWLSRNGTYQAEGRRGDRSNGRWTVKDGKVCLRQSHPLTLPLSYCTPEPSAREWSAKAVTGEPIKVRLQAGGRPG